MSFRFIYTWLHRYTPCVIYFDNFLSGSIIYTIKKIPVFFICTYWFIQVYEQMQHATNTIFGTFD